MAFNNPEVEEIRTRLAEHGAEVEKPLGGSIGKDGDCLLIVGMQQDVLWGLRPVPDPDGVGQVISRLLTSLESRRESRWVVCAVKDWIPREHCAFGERGTRYKERDYCIAGTQGCKLMWRVRQPLAVLRHRTARRVVIGFKNFHDSIFSPASFPYTQELIDDLADVGARRDRDWTRHASKLFVYSGAVAARCSAQALPRRADPSDMDAPPDLMALEPQGIAKRAPQLADALKMAMGNKQVRRLFVCGVPFDEDVLDTALSAAPPRGQKAAGNVHIILDACRPRAGARLATDEEAKAFKGDPAALRRPRTPSAREVAGLLAKYAVRLTSFADIVCPAAQPRTERIDKDSIMFLPAGPMFMKLFSPQIVTPSDGIVRAAPAVISGEVERDDADSDEQNAKEEPQDSALLADDDDMVSPFSRDAEAPEAKEAAAAAAARSIVAEDAGDILRHVAPFAHHLIRNARGEWEVGDLAPKQRLGYHFCKWLGRAEDGVDDFRPGCPVLRLRTKFPASLATLNLVMDPNKFGNANVYGSELFQLRSEEGIACGASVGFSTHLGAMIHVHRVLAKVVSARTLSFYTARIGVALENLSDPNSMHPADLVREADLHVRHIRARPHSAQREPIASTPLNSSRGSSSTPPLSPEKMREEEMQEAEWWAARQRQLADEWQNELFLSAEMGRWITERRRRLVDEAERSEFDMACCYSVAELATLGAHFMRVHLMVSGRPQMENQIAYRGGGSQDIVLVQACGPDFGHPRSGAFELGRHFEQQDAGRDGAWLPDGQDRLRDRAVNTWRSVLRAFQAERAAELSLTTLCGDSRSLTGVPFSARQFISDTYLETLLRTLEDSWGFVTVYIHVADQSLRKRAHIWIEEKLYALCCNVVLHDRDPKYLARELCQRQRLTGLLCPADAAAVLLGALGGYWERQGSTYYGMAEDLAHTSTMLLGHVGVRNDGIATDRVIFHAADTPVQLLLGHPADRNAVRWHRPGGVTTAAPASPERAAGDSEGSDDRAAPRGADLPTAAAAQTSRFAVPGLAAPAAKPRPSSAGQDSSGGSGEAHPSPQRVRSMAPSMMKKKSTMRMTRQTSQRVASPVHASGEQRPSSAGRPPTGRSPSPQR